MPVLQSQNIPWQQYSSVCALESLPSRSQQFLACHLLAWPCGKPVRAMICNQKKQRFRRQHNNNDTKDNIAESRRSGVSRSQDTKVAATMTSLPGVIHPWCHLGQSQHRWCNLTWWLTATSALADAGSRRTWAAGYGRLPATKKVPSTAERQTE